MNLLSSQPAVHHSQGMGCSEHDLMLALGQCFFDVVPLQYRTYCSLTARVAKSVLEHYGVGASLLNCQLWCISPATNYVVGFIDQVAAQPGKWNGHVICATDEHFIDAAIFQLKRDFALAAQVPNVVVGERFRISSHAISRVDLADQMHLFWLEAAKSGKELLPADPPALVEQFAAALIDHLDSKGVVTWQKEL